MNLQYRKIAQINGMPFWVFNPEILKTHYVALQFFKKDDHTNRKIKISRCCYEAT